MIQNRRVVVTGMGALAPGAMGVDPFWEMLIEGRTGIAPFSGYAVEGLKVKVAGEIKGFEPKKFIENRKSLKVMARDIQLAVAASKLVMEDSGLLDQKPDPTRFGISLGAGLINTSIDELRPAIDDSIDEEGKFNMQKFGAEGIRALFPLWLLKYLPNMLACHISILYDAQGPSNSLTTGCAASSQAMGEACRIIQRGDADVMIAGGAESKIDPLSWSRFDMLGLLTKNEAASEKGVKPFDANRDGMVIGEAAGMLILEELEHAKKRGAKIYGELLGFASTANPSIIFGKVDSCSQKMSIQLACKDAQVANDEIDYIQAYGLGLKELDRLETEAIKGAFQEQAYSIPVSSFKAATGYTGAASGALEAIVVLKSIQNNLIPPTLNYETVDPECDLDYVPNSSREKKVNTALVNTFGVGGQNATLVFSRFTQ